MALPRITLEFQLMIVVWLVEHSRAVIRAGQGGGVSCYGGWGRGGEVGGGGGVKCSHQCHAVIAITLTNQSIMTPATCHRDSGRGGK